MSVSTRVPSTITSPRVGRSIPASSESSVDLPLPDSPMTATNSPASMDNEMSSSAVKGPAGVSYCRETPRKTSCGVGELSMTLIMCAR
ncbi:MAG: hypothetical protein ABMA00_00565 [Gemmatimonas sp.]